jgi:FixJ family two-component response regulator
MRLPTALSVWIVDDDPMLLESLQLAFRRQGWPVETFQSASQARHRLQLESPGCLVVDLQLGADNGIELVRQLREASWPAPAALMSGHLNIHLAVEAMRGGVNIVVEKPFALEHMMREVGGLLAVAAAERDRLQRRLDARQMLAALNPGQRAVLNDLVECRPQKQIASRQGIAVRTVEKRKREIFDRLKVKTFTELLDLVELADARPPVATPMATAM